jgi:hypothetical protein
VRRGRRAALALALLGATLVAAIEHGADPRTLPAGWHADLEKFKRLRAKYVLYP